MNPDEMVLIKFSRSMMLLCISIYRLYNLQNDMCARLYFLNPLTEIFEFFLFQKTKSYIEDCSHNTFLTQNDRMSLADIWNLRFSLHMQSCRPYQKRAFATLSENL